MLLNIEEEEKEKEIEEEDEVEEEDNTRMKSICMQIVAKHGPQHSFTPMLTANAQAKNTKSNFERLLSSSLSLLFVLCAYHAAAFAAA